MIRQAGVAQCELFPEEGYPGLWRGEDLPAGPAAGAGRAAGPTGLGPAEEVEVETDVGEQPVLFREMKVWVESWLVSSRQSRINQETGEEERQRYKVSHHEDGFYGCSCGFWVYQKKPHWQREPCHHILWVKQWQAAK